MHTSLCFFLLVLVKIFSVSIYQTLNVCCFLLIIIHHCDNLTFFIAVLHKTGCLEEACKEANNSVRCTSLYLLPEIKISE